MVGAFFTRRLELPQFYGMYSTFLGESLIFEDFEICRVILRNVYRSPFRLK